MLEKPIIQKDELASVVETLIGNSQLKKLYSNSDEEFKTNIHKKLIHYILEQANVDSQLIQNHSPNFQIEQWDTKYIGNLALNFEKIKRQVDKNKIKLVLEKSVKGCLPKYLGAVADYGTELTDIQKFNKSVLEDLSVLGVESDLWHIGSSKEKIIPVESEILPDKFLTFNRWKRDFRTEYSLGNYSQCCIGIGGDSKGNDYPSVLFDYFLDLSINVFNIKSPSLGSIGQMYLVALADEAENPVLGITSVEFAEKYKSDKALTDAVISQLTNSDGLVNNYNFDYAVIGPRFTNYSEIINTLRTSAIQLEKTTRTRLSSLRQIRNNIVNKRKNLNVSFNYFYQTFSKDVFKRERANKMIGLLETNRLDLQELINDFSRSKIHLTKIGNDFLMKYQGTFKGTNYLDIFGGFLSKMSDFDKEVRVYIPQKTSLTELHNKLEQYRSDNKKAYNFSRQK